MLVTRRAEILIKADPEQIWDFVNDPAQWMASNREEHFGTEFFTPDKKVATGGASTSANRWQGSAWRLDPPAAHRRRHPLASRTRNRRALSFPMT